MRASKWGLTRRAPGRCGYWARRLMLASQRFSTSSASPPKPKDCGFKVIPSRLYKNLSKR